MESNMSVSTITVREFFEQDHDRLDNLFRDFQKWKNENYLKAKENFVAFKFGLQRHIVWEEEVLFSFFERNTGITEGGPTAIMRQEHRMIGEMLEALHKKVQVSDPNSEEEEKQLLSILEAHNYKEESVLYPLIDALANNVGVVQKLFEKMRQIPEERYRTCCQHS
jgi:iron-sulfur cluster repair protein YtfE (RIC family)